MTENPFQSELAPVRPSSLLGDRLRFERCTWVSFSPDALFRVIAESTFNRLLEENSYKGYRALLAWAHSVESGSQMQQGTRKNLDELFAIVTSRGGVKVTAEDFRRMTPGLSMPWRLTRFSFWRGSTRLGRRLLTRLAYYERAAVRLNRIPPSRRADMVPTLVREGHKYWYETGLGMTPESIFLLDSTLHHLAWLDAEFSRGSACTAAGAVIALADPEKRVMRHWFDLLLKSKKECSDLFDLHELVDRRGGRIRGEIITHGRIKKWASSSCIFPYKSAKVILTACYGENLSGHPEVGLLWCAKVLTFLTEMVRSFSAQPVAPLVAQGHMHARLLQIREELRATKGANPKELFFL